MIQQMTLDDRKIFPDIFHPVSLPTEEPLWVPFDWSAISLDIQLRSVPYFTTNRKPRARPAAGPFCARLFCSINRSLCLMAFGDGDEERYT